MTAIAGFIHNGKVWIGGDSAGVSNFDLTLRSDAKVFCSGPFVFGFTSSFRMGQLLRYRFAPPVPHDDDVMKFMTVTFIDELRSCLKDGGYAQKKRNRKLPASSSWV
jgi:hypothetical protein